MIFAENKSDPAPTFTPDHLAKLASSGLTPDQAAATGHRSVTAAEAKQLTGHELPGLLLSYTDPAGKPYCSISGKWARKPFFRLRPDWHRAMPGQLERYADSDGSYPKYLSPRDCGNRPYFSPLGDWERVQRKTSELVLLTEGELKGDAGCAFGFPTIAGAGVQAFVDRNSRGEWTGGSGSSWDVDSEEDDGGNEPVARFLPELENFPWKNRPIGIVFDSDITKKFPVRKSLESLLTHARARAGVGFPILLPNELDGSKNGLDDFLFRHGREALALIIECFWSMQNNRNAMAKYGPTEKLKGGTKILGGKNADGQPHDGSQSCLLKLTEPEPHAKAIITWAVLKEGWAYRPSLGWYRWQGRCWEVVGDSVLLGGEIGRFFDAQNWQQRNGGHYAYCAEEMARRCFVPEAIWDSAHYLSFDNGVLDTRDSSFHAHDPKFYCTSSLPYAYDPAAQCPNWLRYLGQATGNDQPLQELLRAWCRWILAPKDRTRKSPIEKSLDLVGRKGSGKGTFLDILMQLVGEENCGVSSPDTFSTPEGLGQLIDKKMAIDTDTSGYMPGIGNFNKVVSNEPVGIKKLFKDKSMQRLCVVVVRSYNDFISVPSSGTEGLDRRLCVVPFRFPPTVPDHDLDIKLRSELPGIFAWAWGLSLVEAQALIRWSGSIDAVKQASIERFLNDHPEVKYLLDAYPRGQAQIGGFSLYEGYKNWAKDNGHKACSNTKFGTLMNELGIAHNKGGSGVIFYDVPDMENGFDFGAYLRISPQTDRPTPPQTPQKTPSNPDPHSVTEGSEGCPETLRTGNPLPARFTEGSEGTEGLAILPQEKTKITLSKGCFVTIAAKGTWYKHGSNYLKKAKPEMPIAALPDWLQRKLLGDGWIFERFSGDGQRAAIRLPGEDLKAVLSCDCVFPRPELGGDRP